MTFLTHPPYRASTKDLEAAKMKSRLATLRKKAKAITGKPEYNRDPITDFVARVAKLTAHQRAITYQMLIQETHIMLLMALDTHGLRELDTATVMRTINQHASDHQNDWVTFWPLIEQLKGQSLLFAQWSVLPNNLPIKAWLDLKEHADAAAGEAPLLGNAQSHSIDVYQGVPGDGYNPEDLGRVMESLYRRHMRYALTNGTDPLGRPRTQTVVHDAFQLTAAGLSGWPMHLPKDIFPLISATNDKLIGAEVVERRYLRMKSAHDWMEFGHLIDRFSDSQRHCALGALKTLETLGHFDMGGKITVIKNNPTLKSLFT